MKNNLSIRGGGLYKMIKNNLKVLRAQHSWSQTELADRAQVSRPTISSIENYKYTPTLELAFRIAMVFGFQDDINKVFYWENEK